MGVKYFCDRCECEIVVLCFEPSFVLGRLTVKTRRAIDLGAGGALECGQICHECIRATVEGGIVVDDRGNHVKGPYVVPSHGGGLPGARRPDLQVTEAIKAWNGAAGNSVSFERRMAIAIAAARRVWQDGHDLGVYPSDPNVSRMQRVEAAASRMRDCAQALREGGTTELTISTFDQLADLAITAADAVDPLRKPEEPNRG